MPCDPDSCRRRGARKETGDERALDLEISELMNHRMRAPKTLDLHDAYVLHQVVDISVVDVRMTQELPLDEPIPMRANGQGRRISWSSLCLERMKMEQLNRHHAGQSLLQRGSVQYTVFARLRIGASPASSGKSGGLPG